MEEHAVYAGLAADIQKVQWAAEAGHEITTTTGLGTGGRGCARQMEHDVCALECTRELICVAQRAGQPGHALERRIVIPCTTIDPYDRTKCQELGTQIRPQEATATNDGTGQATQRMGPRHCRSEEHTSELQSLLRNAYAI